MNCGKLILLVLPIITRSYPILLKLINTKFYLKLFYIIRQDRLEDKPII